MLNYKYYKLISNLIKSNNIKDSVNNIYVNSSFNFTDSYNSELFFKNSNFYNTYSRINNPTFKLLENKLKKLDKVNNCLLFSSGMAAIINSLLSLLNSYYLILSFKNLFSSTLNLFVIIFFKFNISVKFFNSNDNFIIKIINSKIKIFYLESPDNPLLNILSLKNISYLTNKNKLYFFIDNTLSTSVLQKSSKLGCDFIIYSSTKFIDGKGRLLGGILSTNNTLLFKIIFDFYKISGSVLSVITSWILIKSIQDLIIRIKNNSINSIKFLNLFKFNKFLFNLYYTGYYKLLDYLRFMFNLSISPSIISLDFNGMNDEIKRISSWKILNNSNNINITANLGDIKTILNHSTSTTHLNLNFIEKKNLNINESLIRFSLGVESINDIFSSLNQSFKYF